MKGAQTAVVCLRSTEDTILIRSCDSLFKFADKSDANKLLLHEMGATDILFTLTHHENSIVQRNATMVFGIMAAHRKLTFYYIYLNFSFCLFLYSGYSTTSSKNRLHSTYDITFITWTYVFLVFFIFILIICFIILKYRWTIDTWICCLLASFYV